MSITIDEAKVEVAKLKSDLVERLDRFHKDTGLRLLDGIDIRYLDTAYVDDPSPRYLISRVEFDVTL